MSLFITTIKRLYYTLSFASTGLDHLSSSECLNSLWCRFNKVLNTFLRDFGPY